MKRSLNNKCGRIYKRKKNPNKIKVLFSLKYSHCFFSFCTISHATFGASSIVYAIHQIFVELSSCTSSMLAKSQPIGAFISLYDRPTCRHLCNHINIIRCGSNAEITGPTCMCNCFYTYIYMHRCKQAIQQECNGA